MKETVVFTVGVIVVITLGVLLFRSKPKKVEQVSLEQLRRTLDRAEKALASANAEIERRQGDTSLDYNPLLKQMAVDGNYQMRDILQDVYDGALKAVQEREAKEK